MPATTFAGSPIEVPPLANYSSDASSSVGAAGAYVTYVCMVPATGTIANIHVRVAAGLLVGTLSCQIQTLDASGDPSGVAYGGSAQVDIVNPGQSQTLSFNGVNCSATQGQYMAIRIFCSAFTSGAAAVAYQIAFASSGNPFPYATVRTTGAGVGTKTLTCLFPTIEYSGGVYYGVAGVNPACTITSESVDADGAIRRIGNRFILPVPMTVIGAWARIDNDTDTTTIVLYDTDGTTALATATLVTANRGSTTPGWQYVYFPAAVSLLANTASPYRIAVVTSNTSSTACTVAELQNIVAAHMAMLPLGTNMYYTNHNGTVWADTNTKRAGIGLLVSGFDDGRSGPLVFGGRLTR